MEQIDNKEGSVKEGSKEADNSADLNPVSSEQAESLITYSAKELSEFRSSPACALWPKFLDESFKNARGNWDPDRWHQSRKPPSEDSKKKDEKEDRPTSSLSNDSKRNLKDPKERLRAEQQQDVGLVLGPRRRSFNTGCQISQPATTSNQEVEKKDNAGQKEIEELKERVAAMGRNRESDRMDSRLRVGSGRILNRDHRDDYESSRRYNDYGFNRRGGRQDEEGGWFNDRRNYDDDYRRGGGRGRDDHKRGGGGRREAEEPEWMSAPVNQDELMELRGFDESPEKEPNAEPQKKLKEDEERRDKMGDVLGEVLHLDSIPGLANILEDDASLKNRQPLQEGSRFSQFFQKPSDNERSEMAKQPTIRIPSPGDPSACFAPISPAAQTNAKNESQVIPPNPLMDMLRGNQGKELSGLPPMPQELAQMQGKDVKSVEELEADIKRFGRFPSGGGRDDEVKIQQLHQMPSKDPGNQDEDLSAFKKFAAMLEMNNAETESAPNRQPHQMPPNFQMRQSGMGGLIRPMPMPPHPMTEDDLINSMPSRPQMMGAGLPHQPPPPPPMRPQFPPNEAQIQQGMLVLIHRAPMNVDILKRPEAQSLQACLEQGNVQPALLLHQFIHGNLAPFQREILLNVLKVAQNQGLLGPVPDGGGGLPQQSPRTSPVMPDNPFMMLMNQQQRSTLSVSPLPPQQRVPSPQELVIHNQQILQNALLKRKLKEQEESYRKRMEHHHQKGDGDAVAAVAAAAAAVKSSNSPTSLAFAPTVVMKKMAADRRDSDPKLVLPEVKVSQASREHAIGPHGEGGSNMSVVNNNNNNNKEEGERMSPGRLLDQIAQRNPGMPQMPMPPMPNGSNPMAMMQQIRAQQQFQMAAALGPPISRFVRAPRQNAGLAPGVPSQLPIGPHLMGGGSRGPSPSSMLSGPQGGLSRFFSPEVLAQANAGNAPSMPPLPTQKAMTLEEIELQAAAVRI